MTRIAISSVGSLVGQNILDSLQGRRAGIEIVGINSTAAAASNFRCDRAYLAPPAASGNAYLERLSSVFVDERPDLVLPGRDDDVPALARLKETQAQLSRSVPVGPCRLALVLGDKWASREFARARHLPYVDSAPADDGAASGELLARYGYPLIAKPRQGNGSRGVRIVFDDRQREAIAALPGYLLQPYLEPEAELMTWRHLARDGTPLFHAPTLQQIACQAIIGPDRRVRGLLCTVVELVMGRLERTWRLDDPGVADVARRYAEAFAADGWIGGLNLQGRRDGDGIFNVYELNGRLTGGTTARLHLGFDEVALLVEAFTGCRLPGRPSLGSDAIVTKSLTEFAMRPADIERLQADGCWRSDVAGRAVP
jgi:carbamoyl-phosphate synthase large subunit